MRDFDRQKTWEKQNKQKYLDGSIKRNCKDCQIEFSPTSRKRYHCNPCESKRAREYRKNNRDKTRAYQRNRHYQKREIVLDHYRNNPCAMCGEDRLPCLQLDHIDPSTKSFAVSQISGKNEQQIREEISKCRVLCANCHSIRTAEQQGWYKHK